MILATASDFRVDLRYPTLALLSEEPVTCCCVMRSRHTAMARLCKLAKTCNEPFSLVTDGPHRCEYARPSRVSCSTTFSSRKVTFFLRFPS